MRLGRGATTSAVQQAQNRWGVIHVEFSRQEIQILLDEPRYRRTLRLGITLRTASYVLINAQRQLRHVRIIPLLQYRLSVNSIRQGRFCAPPTRR